MTLHDLVQQVAALQQQAGQDGAVEGELHLVEADGRHGSLVELLSEALDGVQLVCAEAAVAVENAQLERHLDEVTDDAVRLLLALGELAAGPVQLVQDGAAGVVRQQVGHRHGRHLAQDLLLRLQRQALRVKRLGPLGDDTDRLT